MNPTPERPAPSAEAPPPRATPARIPKKPRGAYGPGLVVLLLLFMATSCVPFTPPAVVVVQVTSEPPGAAVELDGVRMGKTPYVLNLAQGRECRGVVVVRLGQLSRRFHVKRKRVQGTTMLAPLTWVKTSYSTWETTPLHVDFPRPWR